MKAAAAAAVVYTLIETARLNNVDPEAWLGDVIGRASPDHPTELKNKLLHGDEEQALREAIAAL